MRRLDSSRIGRILVWTGAGLTWGTVLTGGKLEPLRTGVEAPAPSSTLGVVIEAPTTIPTQPESGLVILRFTPGEEPKPEVRTVYVQRQQPAPASNSSSAAPAPAAPAPAPPAPAPTSSGS